MCPHLIGSHEQGVLIVHTYQPLWPQDRSEWEPPDLDSNIIGISPDYVVHVKESVLATFDGPTLQHAIKEMNGEALRQLPRSRAERPGRDLLAARFETFHQAS